MVLLPVANLQEALRALYYLVRSIYSTISNQVMGFDLGKGVLRACLSSAAQHPTHFSLHTHLSCSGNTGGGLLCSTRFIVLPGTGCHCLAVNRQGTIIYNLPYMLPVIFMPPVIYRVIFQQAAALELVEHHGADVHK